MANNSAKAANVARVLAVAHIVVGFTLICVGVAEHVKKRVSRSGYIYFGIWTGVWMCITGGLGIPGTRKKRSTHRNTFAGVFMGFSTTSAVFGGILLIICSDVPIAYGTPATPVTGILGLLGVIECGIGIWAAVCICRMNPCKTRNPRHQWQVMYTDKDVYVMTLGPRGVPVAIPMQAGVDAVAVQTVTSAAQRSKTQMVMVPFSGENGYQSQFVQVACAGAMATEYQLQHAEMPPPYEEKQYIS